MIRLSDIGDNSGHESFNQQNIEVEFIGETLFRENIIVN